jgi:hypothetical protein
MGELAPKRMRSRSTLTPPWSRSMGCTNRAAWPSPNTCCRGYHPLLAARPRPEMSCAAACAPGTPMPGEAPGSFTP